MSFVERVNQCESLASGLNWLTEPPAVSWSVIMGHLSAIWKGEIWTHPNAFRTGPGSCAVHSMDPRWLSRVKYDFIENANIGLILRLVDINWKHLLMCCIWWLTISTLILLRGWAQMRLSTLEFCYNLNKMTRKWYKNSIKSGLHRCIRTTI